MNAFDQYLNETLNMLNERSINKINKEFSEVVVKMAELAKEYSAAEGDAKAKILAELKELTAKKKALTNELDVAVAGKNKDLELAIKESEVTEAKKFYTTKDIVKLAKAAGDWVIDSKYAIQDLAVAYGDKVPAKELNKVLANYDLELEDLMEAHNAKESGVTEGKKVTLKRRYTENHPAITVGKYAKVRNTMLEAIKDGKLSQEEFNTILKEMTTDSKRWMRTNSKYFRVSEEGVSLSKFGQKILKSITVNESNNETGLKVYPKTPSDFKKLTKWLDLPSSPFGIIDDREGLIFFPEITQKMFDLEDKLSKEFNKAKISARFKSVWESFINERNTKLYVYPSSKKDHQMISNWLDRSAFHAEEDSNSFMFPVSGQRDADATEKELDKEFAKLGANARFVFEGIFESTINEATKKNPQIWVPGGFDKEISKYPDSKITKEIVSKAAKKWDIDLEDAIKYVEYGWELDLNKNNNTNMTTKFIYESFSEFVENKLNESTLNEAFASAKLASILTGANKMDKDLPKAFYNMAKIALDKIQDVDIIEMTPEQARKEKRANAVYLYFTTNEKENPYAGRSAWRDERNIPGNTLLAITDGLNEWMATEWQKTYSRDKKATKTLKTTKRDDSAGFPKSGSRSEYGSGISSMKQVVELADRAYCLDLDILRARYSTATQRDEREAAKKGAIAFKNDKEFKAENLNRYNTIIANRAAKMPIDDMVKDAIDTLSTQIKDAMSKGEKGQYGDIIVGKTDKGREAKLSDAANHMQHILDDFQRYVNYTNQAEEEKKAGYGGDYYTREVKKYAKSITDRIKQINNFSYAW